MTQEVEVLVKITFEVNADCPASELPRELDNWISQTMGLMDDKSQNFEFVSSDIIYIKEESELYGNR